MKSISKLIAIVFIVHATMVNAQTDLPTISDLHSGWNIVATDGVCSTGTPFQFFARPMVDSTELLVYFKKAVLVGLVRHVT